ncbi:uncharacterized protein tnfrsf13b [Odontesthes bonariensis]
MQRYRPVLLFFKSGILLPLQFHWSEGLSGPMGGRCNEVEYWDALIRKCMRCHALCQLPDVMPRCISYCDSASCKAKPGHYYDRLLKKCITCAEICGKHPAECSHHCSTLPPPVTTKMLLIEVTRQTPNTRMTLRLDDFSVLLYSLLAVSMVLLFFSLTLALVVLIRGRQAKPTTMGPTTGTEHKQNCVVQPGPERNFPVSQAGMSSKGFQTSSSYPAYREQSDDSSPTETCVCVHCFPDLRILCQDSHRPLRTPYQQAVLHKGLVQNGDPVCTEGSLYISGLRVQEEAAVG